MDLSDCQMIFRGYVLKYSKCDEHFFDRVSVKNRRVGCDYVLKGRIAVHRLIMGLRSGDRMEVDHINHDGLDNRRCNLRICTSAQNLCNRRKNCEATSQYKGVYWYGQRNKWRVDVSINGRTKYVGIFANELDAAMAYDLAAKQHYGEFAYLNFPSQRNTLAANGILQGSAASF